MILYVSVCYISIKTLLGNAMKPMLYVNHKNYSKPNVIKTIRVTKTKKLNVVSDFFFAKSGIVFITVLALFSCIDSDLVYTRSVNFHIYVIVLVVYFPILHTDISRYIETYIHTLCENKPLDSRDP